MVLLNRYGKAIFNFIFGSFIIVWLGNYLYEKLSISQVFDNLVNQLSTLPTNYIDSKVQLVMNGSAFASNGILIATISLMTIILCCFFLIQTFKKREKRMQKNKLFLTVIFIALQFVNFFNALVVTSLNNNICIQTPKNIEIIRPYISDNDYLKMKSNFFQINSYNDYQTINSEITSIAKTNNLTIR